MFKKFKGPHKALVLPLVALLLSMVPISVGAADLENAQSKYKVNIPQTESEMIQVYGKNPLQAGDWQDCFGGKITSYHNYAWDLEPEGEKYYFCVFKVVCHDGEKPFRSYEGVNWNKIGQLGDSVCGPARQAKEKGKDVRVWWRDTHLNPHVPIPVNWGYPAKSLWFKKDPPDPDTTITTDE